MDENTFGKLVRSYRTQRGWKQQDLAERWGFTREYVSQIERGKRKLDKQEQVVRLAAILEIPQERLASIGRSTTLSATNTQTPFRPLRYQGSYHIEKAQAYCSAGYIKEGQDQIA